MGTISNFMQTKPLFLENIAIYVRLIFFLLSKQDFLYKLTYYPHFFMLFFKIIFFTFLCFPIYNNGLFKY